MARVLFWRTAALCVGVALLAACGSASRSRPENAAEKTILAVENQGFADMAIYAVDGARRVRIGLAPGHTTTELTIPLSVASTSAMIRFLADPVGSSRTSVSNEVHVSPGGRMLLVIPPR